MAHGAGYGVVLSHGDAHITLGAGKGVTPASIGLHLDGARRNIAGTGRLPLSYSVNYFIGNDPSKWRTGIPTFGRVIYRGVYPGVDLAYYGRAGKLEYDFIVSPGADVSRIGIVPDGARHVAIDAEGNLVLSTTGGDVLFRKPVTYQMIAGARRPVESSYRMAGSSKVKFTVGSYDHRYPLTIDPTLVYSTYLGGSSFDYGTAIAVSSSGNAYVTGYTSSLDFPTENAEQAYFSGSSAIFVAKLSTTGSSLVYATYLGGSEYNYPYSIAVDSTGAAYVTGLTESSDFPTMNALYGSLSGSEDAFVTKFSPSGTSLMYSTYLGGSGPDYGLGITVDSNHNAYIAGETQSTDFPTTEGAYQTSSGSSCSFVASLNAAGSALNWATYFGQNCSAQTTAIAVDSQQSTYVTGSAFPGLPVTNGAPQSSFGGGEHDAFIAKLDNAGANLVYCTYLGGSLVDSGTSIAVDSSGDAFVTGLTQSTDLPVSGNPLQSSSGGGYDAFVAELNSTGSAWQYVTYLGGQRDDYGYGIALDASGNAYVAGYSISNDLATTSAVQPSLAGNQHVYSVTSNSGKSWQTADSGLPFTPTAVVVDPQSEAHWLAATAEGLYQSFDSGIDWQAVNGFVGASVYGVAFSPAGGTVYASNFTQIYVSQDSGNSWSFSGVAPCAAANLAVSPTNSTTLYLGYSCGAFSTDGGQDWTILNVPGGFFNALVIDQTNPEIIYAATSSGLYSSPDGGVDWSPATISTLQYPNVTSVAINPSNDADVYAVANGSVYGSTDTGSTWALKSTGITAQVNAIAIAPSNPAVIYAATSAGVFVSTNSAKKWKAGGETTDAISLIAADPASSTTAFAATSVNPDAFVAKINPEGAALVYATYLGGTGLDYALGIALSSSGNAFVTGSTQSPDFPSTSGVLQPATGVLRTTAFVTEIESKTTSCAESVEPTSTFAYSSASSANFSVTAPSGCNWTPKASASWIKIGSHGGPGAGPLAITMAANTGAARSGTVTVGKSKISVKQAKAGCTYTLSTNGLSFPQEGGPQSLNVTTGTGCGWVVTGLPQWLAVTSGASGTGSGSVTLNASPNPFPNSRGGFATIANNSLGSNQDGTGQ